MKIFCWHAQTDTLPRLQGQDTVQVTLPVGVKIDFDQGDEFVPPEVDVVVRGSTEPAAALQPLPTARVQPITSLFLRDLRLKADAAKGEPGANEPLRPYLDIAAHLALGDGNRYFEVAVPDLPSASTLKYEIQVTATTSDGQTHACTSPRYQLVLLDPTFTAADIRCVEAPEHVSPEHWWVLSATSHGAFDCLRLDMLETVYTNNRFFRLPCVKIVLPDRTIIDVAAGGQDGQPVPIVDRNTDTIRVCVPRAGGQPLGNVTIVTGFPEGTIRSRPVDLTQPAPHHPTRLLLLNYCIQAFNDMFSQPLAAYQPPRTYMQITMRDENAQYSSRPESLENGDPDGYALTLDAHRYYKVKSQWAFNAGVLGLTAHDAPEDFQRLRGDVQDGLLVPCNAGFGAHRPAYYEQATNVEELKRGRAVIEALLDYHGNGLDTYYPDQRLYEDRPSETLAYRDAGVRYLVFDRSTVCTTDQSHNPVGLFAERTGRERKGNFLWTDKSTGAGILLIEDEFRDRIDAVTDDELARGKICCDLRQRFMQLITPQQTGPRPLMVYGDDADKASGNGWFDGDYDGHRIHFNDRYQAALAWIAAHPWVEAVTTADLDLARDSAGTLDIASATCPSVDPRGALSVDAYGNRMHFDQWHHAWENFEAVWLGTKLGDLSGSLEQQLVKWPEHLRNELYELAWLYFLSGTHESFWNKEPLEGHEVNAVKGVMEPEDFVIAETLQQRNAWVYLNASAWADWSARATTSDTLLDEGPVIDEMVALGSAKAALPGAADGLFWDHDLLANVILYNRDVLVVLDRNGGCITHLFVRMGGRTVSVSGHFKTFQYLDTAQQGQAEETEPGVNSNGEVFQNTVWTPNHAYVASDVAQARAVEGTYRDPRRPDDDHPWMYPNNFDEYQYEPQTDKSVVFRYQHTADVLPGRLDRKAFRNLCVEDRTRRLRGQAGLVWHDRTTPEFEKRIALQGRTLHIRYTGVPAGHVVANEFCVDLLEAVLGGKFQAKQVAADEQSVTLTAPGGAAVTLRLGGQCRFTPASLTTTLEAAGQLASEYLRLHRVLTDNLEIECTQGGGFRYQIEFPE